MNGGIQPTVELATNNGNNGFYPYPVYPMMSGGFGGNSGFGSGFGDSGWIILLLLLAFSGNWGGNGNGGFFGGNSFDNGFAWLSNGQKEIMNNTNNGFDTLHLSNQLEGTRDGIYSLSNQLCNCCADMNQTVSNGFYNTANNLCNLRSDVLLGNSNTQRDILMQTTQLESQLGMTSLQGLARLDSCCCDIKQAIRDDGEQTRALITQNTIQDLRDRLTAAKDVISDREQTDTLLSRLQPTPTPSYIVSSPYQSIFNPCGCNNGCGCNGNFYGTNF